MGEPSALAPLEVEPVSVHPPFIDYPGGRYRHEYPEERRAALVTALAGVRLGAYDRRVLHLLSWWDLAVAATLVSLILRVRAVAAQDAAAGGGPHG
ncbi:MAG: hypothetical protein M3460_17290 [Actinomycetota bacterium]|nr:hypothetical protein [Actinomycetota bacterium]